MGSHTQITVSQLDQLIGTPRCPVLIDICIDEDFKLDPYLIPGAFRHPHTEVTALSDMLDGKSVIIICQKGLKLSEGAAAILRAQGIAAKNLKGGDMAWREAGKPMIPAAQIPTHDGEIRTLWVTAQG
ncbi:MAG: rhodanese-like domain-containing protein [Pseudomonadota bacterium]